MNIKVTLPTPISLNGALANEFIQYSKIRNHTISERQIAKWKAHDLSMNVFSVYA